jgi:uncharacterized membrane protein
VSAPRPGAQRVIFIDLARALAVLFMLYGHVVDALLAQVHRAGPIYDVWLFQRGLTSSLFLLLSGFAFSIATTRRWSSHLTISKKLFDRVRRFGFFVVLGYALHFPSRFVLLPLASESQWREFLAVDVLQLIGVTFLVVQLLVFLTRERWIFTALALLLAIGAVAATPYVWGIDWTAHLPLWLAAYLSPALGSQFPLLPWSGYILLGIVLGQVYGRWGAAHLAAYANLALLLPGSLMIGGGLWLREVAEHLFGLAESSFVPPEVMIRSGACLLIIGAMAHGTRFVIRLPHVFSAVAQETLLIYFVHLCIVYGSVWSPGLSQLLGASLSPLEVLAVVVVLIAAMVLLAFRWNAIKHASPRKARWIAIAAGAILLARLL